MELTLEILLYFIREMCPIIFSRKTKNDTYVGIKQFFSEDANMSNNYIYVCELTELWRNKGIVSEDITVIAANDVSLSQEEMQNIPCNLVLVDGKYKTAYILNQMISIYSRMANWDKNMHIAALEGKSVQELLNISEGILERPVLLFDASFKLLAYTKKQLDNDEDAFFQETVSRGYADFRVMPIIKKDKILTRLQNGGYVIDRAAGNKNKYIIYLGFYRNQKLYGYGALFLGNEEPNVGYIDVLKYFMENINFCLRRDYDNHRYGMMMYETFLVHLMKPDGIAKEQLQEQLENVGNMPRTGRFVLGVIRFENKDEIPLYFLAKILQAEMWDVKLFIYENQICLLKTMDPADISISVISEFEMNNIKRLLENYEYRMGISHTFNDVINLRHAYTQAMTAMRFGQADNKIYCKYSDYYFEHMLLCTEKSLPIESLESELYKQLKAYDKVNKTQYTKIIVAYLENDCNATHTAEELFMHRNTIRNAVQFVEERWKIDIHQEEEKRKFKISHSIAMYKKHKLIIEQ